MDELRKIIEAQFGEIGIKCDEDRLDLIESYWQILSQWNNRINLTRILEIRDFAIKHVADSLYILKLIDIPTNSKIIDIGTGPGIPGIILKIARQDLNVSLLESQQKKADFLTYTIENLQLKNINVLNDRAEIAAKNANLREKYDFAVARAVSSMSVLAELCIPFVKIGGLFIAMKGPNPENEILAAEKAIDLMGGKISKTYDYSLQDGSKRKLITIKKHSPTPEEFPRRAGLPAKKPL